MTDTKLIRLDLDKETQIECITLLKKRLSFMQDVYYFDSNKIESIELVHKSTYGALIKLKKSISFEMKFSMQALLASDYRKECCSQINHYKFKMRYPDRLFGVKQYPSGKVIEARYITVTKEVLGFVFDESRIKQRF